jgi:hypothetical protein
MLPTFAANNRLYVTKRDTKLFCNILLEHPGICQMPYLTNLLFIQPRFTTGFPVRVTTSLDGMINIRSIRNPFKIRYRIIAPTVVKMIRRVSLWSWTNKRFEHKAMD